MYTYIQLSKEEIELLVEVLLIDCAQYDGVTNQYEMEMIRLYNRIIFKLIEGVKKIYGK